MGGMMTAGAGAQVVLWNENNNFIGFAPTEQLINNYADCPIAVRRVSDGELVARLSPAVDGLREAWITNEANGECLLEFEMPATSDKWGYINDAHYLEADGRHFRLLTEDAVSFKRSGRSVMGSCRLHEVWVMLGRRFATVSNDPQALSPAWGAVRVLSGGADLSGGRFIPGTAGHALAAVLAGSGWTLDVCDVSGTHDLETEKESVLANVNAIQEKWGGILVWDSAGKMVSLRDEELYQNYHGFGVRYAKNLQGIARTDDYKLVTRLYPFGEGDLNIAGVNGGALYLEDFSHSTEVYEGVYRNAEITDAAELKVLGQKELSKLCRPRHYYETELLDLSVFPEYARERFGRDDIVDLVDDELGINTRTRVIRHRYNLLQRFKCEIGCGDPLEKISDMIAGSLTTAETVAKTVLVDSAFQSFLKGVINNAATRINNTTGSYSLADGQSLWVEQDNEGFPTGKQVKISPAGMAVSANGGSAWQTAITGEGIYGQALVAGSVTAGQIAVGGPFVRGYVPLEDALSDMQKMVDGQYMCWFGDVPPAYNNFPASDWTTGALKEEHVGDYYYDRTNLKAYRYVAEWMEGGTGPGGPLRWLDWQETGEPGVLEALREAANAQDTADGKRRTFVTTPVPPYDVGDLWAPGSGGEIKRCMTPRTGEESYNANDWQVAYAGKVNLGTAYNYTTITTADGVKVEYDNLRLFMNGLAGFKIEKKTGTNAYATQFQADSSGNVTMNGASIVNGAIVGGTMAVGSGDAVFKAGGDGIQLGHATFASAPFSVDMTGKMKATNADIKGAINCTSLAINGTSILSGNYLNGGSIAARTITANKIVSGSITANELAANSITAGKIAANAIEAEHIKANAIEADHLCTGAVTAEKIYSEAITTDKLALGATLKSAASGNTRMEIGGSGIVCYNASNQKHGIEVSSGNGSNIYFYYAGEQRGVLQQAGGSFTLRPINASLILGGPERNTKTYGTWDFSDTQVTGITAKFG